MIRFKHKGDFNKTEKFLTRMSESEYLHVLDKYGKVGVNALSLETPVDSGRTAASWEYEIQKRKGSYMIVWSNSNIVKGVPIAVIIQYGHATRNGGYVRGIDYINPALRPIFEAILDQAWREVVKP